MIPHTYLLARHRYRGDQPGWFIVTKLVLILVLLMAAITNLIFNVREGRIEQKRAAQERLFINNGDICVSWNPNFDSPQKFVEGHKPRHYDYGEFGRGEYCPEEDFPKNGLDHGELTF